MRNKKIISTMLFIAVLMITLVGVTGCAKSDIPKELGALTPIEFYEGEAFRIGDHQIGIDTFMLYALDAIPGFESEFGEGCWTQESIDLTWIKEAPQKAFILYLTDIIASSIACDLYYNSTKGELDDSVKEICKEIAHERYLALLEAGMPEGVVSEESIYQYSCSTYKLSYVVNELITVYGDDTDLVQASIMGMRDSIDITFDYDRNINWDLVSLIDYSSATAISSEQIIE